MTVNLEQTLIETEKAYEALEYENLTLKRKLMEAERIIEHVNKCGLTLHYIPYDTGLQPRAPGQSNGK